MENSVFNRNIYVYDLETLFSCITYTGYNIDTQEVVQFVLHKEKFQLLELINHLNTCKGHIGYNNISFDYPIIHFVLSNYNRWININFISDWENVIISEIYNKSQEIIQTQNEDKFANTIQEKNWKISQLDLFRIWHFDNKNKKTSLKWIQFSIDYPNIEEMPLSHTTDNISLEQVDSILSYNLNDVMSTYELYKITKGDTEHPLYKGIDKIQLRKDIIEEFQIKCLNYNDVKIGDEINKITYSKLSGINKWDLPKKGTFRSKLKVSDCIKLPVQFESLELQHFYKEFGKVEFNPQKVKDEKGREFTFKGLDITFGFGGIHSIDKPRKIVSDSEYYLSDKDCTGMYPRAIIEQQLYPAHLGPNWYKGCEYIYNERAYKYKPLIKKGDKKAQSFSEAYKLANNGGSFGKTNEVFSWQYDPLVTFSVTIFNQFALLRLAEMLLLNNISVVSLNTDGCLSLVRHDQKDLYEDLSKQWEALSKHTLEETLYSQFIQTSVNDYIAVTTDGKVKKKGDFTTEFELHKNKSARIVPIALEKYYLSNIPVEKTIKEHKNIYDFCLGVKSIDKNRLIAFDKKSQTETELQKINRYYISNDGIYLLKKLPKLETKRAKMQLDIFGNLDDGTRTAEVEAGWLSTIFNKYVEKEDYNICYKYYIERCNKIINKIN